MGDEGTAAPVVHVPGYVVLERLGSGGFGDIFRARHAVIDREVAIKILHATYSTNPDAVARFVAEARAVNKVSHPGIVETFDFGHLDDGRQYCVMELVRGKTLRDVLRDRTRLPLDEALPILRGIAEAVDAAHGAGIAHRDLKPDNVFVVDGGGVKLIDFGLAKLTREDPALGSVTQSGAVFGTPLYMSPEQCHGKPATLATDAYSFGVLAYQVLTGELPFSGDALGLALQHINDPPDPPSRRCAELSERVDRVVLALLAKDPATRRLPLVLAIDAITGAAPLPPAVRRRRRIAWLAGALVVAGALAATAMVIASDGAGSPQLACASPAQRLAGMWDAQTRSAIEARFAAVKRPDLPSTWRAVAGELDAFSAQWTAQWDDACRSPEPIRAPRVTCLENALLGLRSASDLLHRADVRDLSDGWGGDLTDDLALHDCETPAALRSQLAILPAANRDETTQLMTGVLVFETTTGREVNRLAELRGRPSLVAAPAALDKIGTRLEALGSAGANAAWTVRAWDLKDRVGIEVGDGAGADPHRAYENVTTAAVRQAIELAITRAELTRDDHALAIDGLLQAELELDAARAEKAEAALARSEAARVRSGALDTSPWIAEIRARIEASRGQFAPALERLQAATALEERFAPTTVESGAPRVALLSRAGRHGEAIAEARARVAAMARGFGDDHLTVATAYGTLERALGRAGDVHGAMAAVEHVGEINRRLEVGRALDAYVLEREAAYGFQLGKPEVAIRALAARAHGDGSKSVVLTSADWVEIARLALSRGWLEGERVALAHIVEPLPPTTFPDTLDDATAYVDFMTGDLDGMRQHAARVRPVFPKSEIGNSSWIARVETAPWLLAIADATGGRRKEAAARLQTLARFRVSSDPFILSTAYTADGWVYAALERWPDARISFEQARAASRWGRDWNLAEIDAWLGAARVEAGDPKAAIEPLEEALDVLASCCDGFHYFAPLAELSLARALWETGGDRARARRLAEEARDHFARLGRFKEPERRLAQRWLDEHAPSVDAFAPAVSYPVGVGPFVLHDADLNGDGKRDLIVAEIGKGTIGVLINKGDGTFAPEVRYPTGGIPFNFAVGDVDGDGKPDLAVSDYGDNTVSVLINRGDGTFAPRVTYPVPGPYGIAIGDLDGDGRADIVVTSHQTAADHTVHVLLNQGDGTFAPQVPYATVVGPYALALADLDGDGALDVVVTNGDSSTSEIGVLLNLGHGRLAPQVTYTTGVDSGDLAIGDLDGDGKPDIVWTSGHTNTVGVLFNRGNGTFEPKVAYPTGQGTAALSLTDVNGDGKLDIVSANYGDSTVGVLLNRGERTFATQLAYPVDSKPTSVVCVDVNGDGKPDVVTTSYYGTNTVSVLLHR